MGTEAWFTRIPNIIEDDERVDAWAYRLYGHYRRWAGESGDYSRGLRETAELLHTSQPTVLRAKKTLVQLGYIRVESRRRESDRRWVDYITIIDIWQENTARYNKTSARAKESLAEPLNIDERAKDSLAEGTAESGTARSNIFSVRAKAAVPAIEEQREEQEYPVLGTGSSQGQLDLLVEPDRVVVTPTPTEPKTKKRKTQPIPGYVPTVTDQFRERMCAKYQGRLTPEEVNDVIDLCLSHEGTKKYKPPDLHVQRWLNDAADKADLRRQSRGRVSNGHHATGPPNGLRVDPVNGLTRDPVRAAGTGPGQQFGRDYSVFEKPSRERGPRTFTDNSGNGGP